jgi:hypothetical protein
MTKKGIIYCKEIIRSKLLSVTLTVILRWGKLCFFFEES